MKASNVIFVAVIMALLAVSSMAAFTATHTYDCSADKKCVAGSDVRSIITITRNGDTTFPANLPITFPLMANSTIGAECALWASDRVIADLLTATHAPPAGSNVQQEVDIDISIPAQFLSVTEIRVNCPYTLPPVRLNGNLGPLIPFNHSLDVDMLIGGQKVPLTLALPTLPNTSLCDGTGSGTEPCGQSNWSAGVGLGGKANIQIYPPFGIDAYDLLEVNSPGFTATSCSVGGSQAQVIRSDDGQLSLGINSGTGSPEMGYIYVSCDTTIPAKNQESTSTVTVKRRYWASADTVSPATYDRFSVQTKLPAATAAVIGANNSEPNDAVLGVFPQSTSPGTPVAVFVQTRNFNSEFQYSEVPRNDDQGGFYYNQGTFTYAIKLGKFLSRPTENPPAIKCALSTNSIVPNYGEDAFTVNQNANVNGGIFTIQGTVNKAKLYTTLAGTTVRFFCTGLVISPTFTDPLPFTPDSTATLTIRSSIGASTIGTSPTGGFPFKLIESNAGIQDTVWAQHTLRLMHSAQLTQAQMDTVISTYRRQLNLSSSATVRIISQNLGTSAAALRAVSQSSGELPNRLDVTLAISGTDTQPTSDILRSLSASTATTISNNLAREFSLRGTLTQSPASSFTLPASCNNTIQDGDETGVDCGGSTCFGCGLAASCVSNSDCSTGICDGETSVCAIKGKGSNSSAASAFAALFATVIALVFC